MSCSSDEKNIVTCLREKGIEPYSNASHINYDITKRPYTVFDYESDPGVYYLHTSDKKGRQWWIADLKRIVYINAYKITAMPKCQWISEWNFSVSLNKKDWKIIHTYNNYPTNETINFSIVYVAKYVNITGYAAACQNDLLAFQRLYLYGAISFGLNTCESKNSFLIIKSLVFITVLCKY